MIILEKPYVSDFLQQTVVRLQVPVLATAFARSLARAGEMNMVEAEPFFNSLKTGETRLLYSNSENATELLNHYAPELAVTRNVNFFKDKSKLREIFSRLDPHMWYHTYSLDQLDDIDVAALEIPFVIKPVRGFASIGIHAVHHASEWASALAGIKKEVKLMQHVFPDVVVSDCVMPTSMMPENRLSSISSPTSLAPGRI